MNSNLVIHLAIYFLMGKMLWRLILKKSAYPEFIPPRVKWFHALILFFVLASVWNSFFMLSWLLHYPNQFFDCLNSQPNSLGKPFVGVAIILQIVTAFPLVFVCTKMAKRRKDMLKWYVLLWPIHFISEIIYASGHEQGHIRNGSIIFGGIFSIIIGLATVAFYFQRSSKSLFENQNTDTAKLV